MRARSALLVLILLLQLCPARALAKFITLQGENKLTVRVTDEHKVVLSGSYEIENRGDETAQNVILSLNLGSWVYATPANTIPRGERKSWRIEQSFSDEQLTCAGNAIDLCADLNLPVRGIFPLRVAFHYQDQNGYMFSAVTVQAVEIGELTSTQKYAAAVPPLQASLTFRRPRGKEYPGVLVLRNPSEVAQKVAVALITSKELAALTKPFSVTVPPLSSSEHTIPLVNFSGLKDSTYIVIAVIQGAADGVRYLTVSRSSVTIGAENDLGPLLLILGAAVVIAGVIGYRLYHVARRKKKQSA